MKRSSHGAAGGASKRRCKGIAVVQLGGGEAKPRQAALWRQGLLCDVQLRVGNEVFPAHRLVLAAESTFLAALFTGHFKDSLAPLVDIHEMAPRISALALDYMYDGTCAVPDITSLQKLLSVASVLQIAASRRRRRQRRAARSWPTRGPQWNSNLHNAPSLD